VTPPLLRRNTAPGDETTMPADPCSVDLFLPALPGALGAWGDGSAVAAAV